MEMFCYLVARLKVVWCEPSDASHLVSKGAAEGPPKGRSRILSDGKHKDGVQMLKRVLNLSVWSCHEDMSTSSQLAEIKGSARSHRFGDKISDEPTSLMVGWILGGTFNMDTRLSSPMTSTSLSLAIPQNPISKFLNF